MEDRGKGDESHKRRFQKFLAVVSHHGLGFDIVELLLNRPGLQARVCEISRATGASKPRVSRALRTLGQQGIVHQMSPSAPYGTYRLIDDELPRF